MQVVDQSYEISSSSITSPCEALGGGGSQGRCGTTNRDGGTEEGRAYGDCDDVADAGVSDDAAQQDIRVVGSKAHKERPKEEDESHIEDG